MTMGSAKSFEHIDKVLVAVETFEDVVRYSEHKWHWKKLREYAQALFERAPFKVGDRVQMTVTPEITPEKSWGWMGARHFLVKGSLATVREVDFSDGHFCAWLHFDLDSWKSDDGTVHPSERKSLFCLWDTQIERVSPHDPPRRP
jgi:hypothetical protein